MNGGVTANKGLFSLQQVLLEDEVWTTELTKAVWKNIKKSPSWKQLVDLNGRLESVESRLGRIENKLDSLLVGDNGGGKP